MQSPLDEDLKTAPDRKGLSTRPVLRAIGYIIVMLGGELAFEYWFTRQLSIYSIRPILSGIFLPVLISAGLELLRWWRYRVRVRRGAQLPPRDPFWFQVVEGAMAIWLLFLLAAFIRLFLL